VSSVDGQLVTLDGRGMMPLLPDSDEVFQFPAFADDGRLAVVQNRRTYDVVSVDPDGGGWECLVCDTQRVGWGSAGPDGSVVYRLTIGDRSRVVLREPGVEARPLTSPDEEASCPVMSPDAMRIAYLARVEGGTELRVRPRAGGEPVTLARGVESSELVAWSPDGRSIAYAGGRPLQVFVVSTAGGSPRAVSPAGGDYPSWSPDGRLISFAVWNEASDPAQGTWVVASGGGEPRKVGEEPTRAVWDPISGELMQLRRSADGAALELWTADPGGWRWRQRSVLDIGVRPPIQMEYLPLTTDRRSGRLVMNRRSGTGRLVVVEGIETDRWK
jgi:dipeptidyl aminopeptidase/acylaminoacyl peptidase